MDNVQYAIWACVIISILYNVSDFELFAHYRLQTKITAPKNWVEMARWQVVAYSTFSQTVRL